MYDLQSQMLTEQETIQSYTCQPFEVNLLENEYDITGFYIKKLVTKRCVSDYK